mmetsp:Transcript_33107/g.54203  ORF Transcript_33107/g.54203 Transcript_33107/m.54203 type:complete len:211 (+) Transcript_33107:1615-2247(+)
MEGVNLRRTERALLKMLLVLLLQLVRGLHRQLLEVLQFALHCHALLERVLITPLRLRLSLQEIRLRLIKVLVEAVVGRCQLVHPLFLHLHFPHQLVSLHGLLLDKLIILVLNRQNLLVGLLELSLQHLILLLHIKHHILLALGLIFRGVQLRVQQPQHDRVFHIVSFLVLNVGLQMSRLLLILIQFCVQQFHQNCILGVILLLVAFLLTQ